MSVVLPKAVQKQVDEAEALARQMGVDPDGEINLESQPVVEPVAVPVAVPTGDTVQVDELPIAAQEKQPEVQPEPQAEPDPEPPKVDFEQRYKTLQSKYDKEVPVLHRQVRELMAEINSIKNPPAPVKAEEVPFDPNDVETFGEDLVGMAQRIAKGIVERELSKRDAVIHSLQQQNAISAEERFWGDIRRAEPDFDVINENPQWIAWLDDVDPLYGATRRQIAEHAIANGDSSRVLAAVNLWKQTSGYGKPAQQPAPVSQASALSKQVAPGKGSAAAVSSIDGKRIWTDADIARELDPRNTRERSPEANARIEADINAALAEGRYRPR